MIDYNRPAEFVVDRLWFSDRGEVFTGRGFMDWNPDEGLRINALLDKSFSPVDPFATLGKVIVEDEEDAFSVWLKVRGVGRAIAPRVFPLRQESLLSQDRLSMKLERVIFFHRYPFAQGQESWSGSAVFLTQAKLEFPDSLKHQTSLNDHLIGLKSERGLC